MLLTKLDGGVDPSSLFGGLFLYKNIARCTYEQLTLKLDVWITSSQNKDACFFMTLSFRLSN